MEEGVCWYVENTTDHNIDFFPFKWEVPITIKSRERLNVSNLDNEEKLNYYRNLYSIGIVLRKEALVKHISPPLRPFVQPKVAPIVENRSRQEVRKTVDEIVDLISPTLPKAESKKPGRKSKA